MLIFTGLQSSEGCHLKEMWAHTGSAHMAGAITCDLWEGQELCQGTADCNQAAAHSTTHHTAGTSWSYAEKQSNTGNVLVVSHSAELKQPPTTSWVLSSPPHTKAADGEAGWVSQAIQQTIAAGEH